MNKKKIGLFLGLTFGVSWTIATVYYLLGGKWNTPGVLIVALVYMFVPAWSVFVVQKVYKENFSDLGISFKLNWWFLVAWVLPVIFALLSFGISLLFPGVEFSPGMEGMFERFADRLTFQQVEQMKQQIASLKIHPIWLGIFQGLIAGFTVNAVAGFGEELGWRGFLVKEFGMVGDHGRFWRISLWIGLIWGIWHAPAILQGHNYPNHALLGVFMMTIWCILLTPIFCYIRLKSKSVVAASIMHGTLNGTYGVGIIMLKGGHELLIGPLGVAGFVALGILNLILYILLKRGKFLS